MYRFVSNNFIWIQYLKSFIFKLSDHQYPTMYIRLQRKWVVENHQLPGWWNHVHNTIYYTNRVQLTYYYTCDLLFPARRFQSLAYSSSAISVYAPILLTRPAVVFSVSLDPWLAFYAPLPWRSSTNRLQYDLTVEKVK